MHKRKEKPSRAELLSAERNITQFGNNAGEFKVHLVYPNSYWIGMSNLGFQAVYSIFAKSEGCLVERGFLPDQDQERDRAEKKWRTLESNRILSDCDLLGFSLSFETDYPNLLKILRNNELLFDDAQERDRILDERAYNAPLLIAGGTALTLNPEPVADFLDAIVIGEAEELLTELIEVVRQGKRAGLSRVELLKKLALVEGVYVPRFYRTEYDKKHAVSKVEHEPFVPARPKRRFVKDISSYPTYTNILTPETEFRSMFLTETGRGCEVGCRFCVAGYIYRPVRKRSEESIAKSVELGLKSSAAVGFVGAAVSSHRAIAKLASSVAKQGARASLSSIMSQRVTPELASSLSESEYKTVALAPEAGSERLRLAAGKRVKNSQIITAARTLAESGIRGFKLYFIVGLPTETSEDVLAIADLAKQVRDAVVEASRGKGRTAWVTLSVNPFIPKASTPFQWEPMIERELLEKKIASVKKGVSRIPNLEMKYESPAESYFQALLSRGDRRVGRLLQYIELQGKDWRWLVQRGAKEIIPGVPPIDFYVTRRIPFEEQLPWEVVDSRIDRNLLMREAKRAHGSEMQGDELEPVQGESGFVASLRPELLEVSL